MFNKTSLLLLAAAFVTTALPINTSFAMEGERSGPPPHVKIKETPKTKKPKFKGYGWNDPRTDKEFSRRLNELAKSDDKLRLTEEERRAR